jgi:hypothetical protein
VCVCVCVLTIIDEGIECLVDHRPPGQVSDTLELVVDVELGVCVCVCVCVCVNQ